MKENKSTQMVTRNKPKKTVSLRLPQFKCSANKILLAVFTVLLSCAAVMGMGLVNEVLTVPIEKVVVKGDLHYQNQKEISAIINRYSKDGFVKVDLRDLYKALSSLPWLYQVSIKRQMPSGLFIQVQEQTPVAYWNHQSLINAFGELFTPETVPVIDGLVQFSGTDHQRVLALYQHLQTRLPEMQQPIKALAISHQHIVSMRLADDVELVLDSEQMDIQLKRWQTISKTFARLDFENIKKVDLRYSNGAAVEWKSQLTARL